MLVAIPASRRLLRNGTPSAVCCRIVSSHTMTPLMLSPSLEVVTISSREARRAGSVWSIPSRVTRRLQVGIDSSIAGTPLSSATNARAVSNNEVSIRAVSITPGPARGATVPESAVPGVTAGGVGTGG